MPTQPEPLSCSPTTTTASSAATAGSSNVTVVAVDGSSLVSPYPKST